MDHPTVELRPMTIADIIDVAIRIYRRHFGSLLGIAAVVQGPMMALQLAILYALMRLALSEGNETDLAALGVLAFGLVVAAVFLLPLGEGALALAVSETYLGEPISVARAYRAAAAHWLQVLWTSILYWGWVYVLLMPVAFAIGAFVAVVIGREEMSLTPPGIAALAAVVFVVGLASAAAAVWAVVRYLLAPAVVVVLENRSGLEAMRRSAALTRGAFWTTFGTVAILSLMVYVAAQGITLPLQVGVTLALEPNEGGASEQSLVLAQLVVQAVGATVMVVLRPISMIGAVLIYYDLRIRKEGFDLMMMAEALGAAPPTSTPSGAEAPLYPEVPRTQPEKEDQGIVG